MMNLARKMVFSVSILAICFSFVACVYTPSTRSSPSTTSGEFFTDPSSNYAIMTKDGIIMQANIVPTKDFTTLGLIFVESSATIDSDGRILQGSKITFEMLMKEAHKMGADDIINIKIDEIENIIVTEETRIVPTRVVTDYGNTVVDKETTVQIITKTVVYKANALAIKYTNAIATPAR